jgi:integrase/recombinase XerD
MLTFERAVSLYLNDLRINNMSPKTIVTKSFQLKQFKAWLDLKTVADMQAVTPELMNEYKTYLFEKVNALGKAYEVRSRNSLMLCCRTLFDFLHKQGHVSANPCLNIKYAKELKRMPSILSVADVRKMLHAPDLSTFIGLRDRACLELLWSSALRESELCGLDLADIDLNTGFIKVRHGKGRRERTGICGAIAQRYLKRYIELSRPLLARQGRHGAVPNTALFLTMRGDRLTGDALFNLVKKYAAKAKVKKNVYPHIFRATAATEMLRKGANLRFIQVYLGHSSLSNLEDYVAILAQDLGKGFRKWHPRQLDFQASKKVENIDMPTSFGDSGAEKALEKEVQGV